MNVKIKLVNIHKSVTADLWHYLAGPNVPNDEPETFIKVAFSYLGRGTREPTRVGANNTKEERIQLKVWTLICDRPSI